jgi:pimeloyl-ACP methyl ester carboxylesterase
MTAFLAQETPMNKPEKSRKAAKPKEFDVSQQAVICDTKGVTLLKDSHLRIVTQLPLPGIVILVHGVNSDGEWYDQAEQGLCQGLNDRLKRRDEHMAFPCPQGGQLTPARYMRELTNDGFINPDRQPDNFIEDSEHFSPVIRFRWGYKASSDELQRYGEGIFLNEQNYWGGGPFANGCTSLPDLWSEGVSQSMFLWWNVGHFNPVDERPVFSCPPRPYFVLAALRLAKLIESIRQLQANTPITIVCHSQGNMVAIAAAFLGDRMPAVGDGGRCVADTYVLCNPPYSLQTAEFIDNWTESHMKDRNGGTGRQTAEARIQTMKNFFDIIRKPTSPTPQGDDEIDRVMANRVHQFSAATDREAFGYGPQKLTRSRVTLYCNPHDQVISSLTIRGIGWLGMSAKEIDATKGDGIFCQRVFAQDFTVGAQGQYHYWANNHRKVKEGSKDFWMPPSPTACYNITTRANENFVGTILSAAAAPVMYLFTSLFKKPINAVPPKGWTIPLNAPNLPKAFKPGEQPDGTCKPFDEGRSAPGEERDPDRARDENDPYSSENKIKKRKGEAERPATDAGRGNDRTEAQLRYEHHARLRMEARQEGITKKDAPHVTQEDKPETASDEYNVWRRKKIKGFLANNVDSNATDHSTIMTDPENARKALAYDVAVGACKIERTRLQDFRKSADWRLFDGQDESSETYRLGTYLDTGLLNNTPVYQWANKANSETEIPTTIIDIRENRTQTIGGH